MPVPLVAGAAAFLGGTTAGKVVAGTALASAAGYGISQSMKKSQDQKNEEAKQKAAQEEQEFNNLLNSEEFNKFAAHAQQNTAQELPSIEDNNDLILSQAQEQKDKEAKLAQNPHEEELIGIAQQAAPRKFRNTGVSMFDNKEHLSIAEAYLAKLLGLNVSYTYMDANINADVKQKKTNMNQALNTMHGNNNAVLSFTQGIPEYVENDLGSTGNALSRAFNRWSGGFFSFSSDANKKEQGYNEYRSRAVARIISDNPRGVTQKDMENARGLVSTNWKDSTGVMADTQNFLEMALIKQREEINKIDNLGLAVPEEERYKLIAIENMQKSLNGGTMNTTKFNTNRKALQMLQEYKNDPVMQNKAIALILAN